MVRSLSSMSSMLAAMFLSYNVSMCIVMAKQVFKLCIFWYFHLLVGCFVGPSLMGDDDITMFRLLLLLLLNKQIFVHIFARWFIRPYVRSWVLAKLNQQCRSLKIWWVNVFTATQKYILRMTIAYRLCNTNTCFHIHLIIFSKQLSFARKIKALLLYCSIVTKNRLTPSKIYVYVCLGDNIGGQSSLSIVLPHTRIQSFTHFGTRNFCHICLKVFLYYSSSNCI